MADDVQVIFDADVSALISAFSQVQDAAQSSMASVEQMGEVGSQAMDDFGAAAKNTTEHLHETKEKIEEFENPLEQLKNSFHNALEVTGIAIAAEALEKVGEEIAALGERATQIQSFSEILGTTVEQIQLMQLAAGEAGTSFELFARSEERIGVLLQSARDHSAAAADKLIDLGITSEKVKDSSFNLSQAIQIIGERLLDTSTKAEEQSELLKVLGPRGALAAIAIADFAKAQEEAKSKLEEVNGLHDEQEKRLHEVAVAWEELETKAKNSLSKLIVDVADAWAAITKSGTSSTESPLAKWAEDDERASEEMAENSGRITEEMKKREEAAKVAAAQALRDQVESDKEAIQSTKQGTSERLAAVKKFYDDISQLYPADTDKVKSAHTALIAEERAYQENRIKEEIRYGEVITKAENDALNERAKAIGVEIQQASILLDETKKENSAELDATKSNIDGQIALRKQLAQSSEVLGGIGGIGAAQAEASQKIALIREQETADTQYYERKKQIAASTAADIERINGEEAKSILKATTEIAKAQQDAAKKSEQEWLTVLKPIGSAFDLTISGMIRGTTTLHQAILNLGNQLLDTFIKFGTEELEKWGAKELAKTALTTQGNAARAVAQETASQTGIAADAVTSLEAIQNAAAVAAAGAFSATAAIPYIGPELAPAAAAAAYAEAISFAGGLAFAKGGIVPYDTMAQVHAGEMVLPQKISTGLQNMISSSSPGGSGGAASGIQAGGATFKLNVQSADENHYFIRKSDLAGFLQTLGAQFKLKTS